MRTFRRSMALGLGALAAGATAAACSATPTTSRPPTTLSPRTTTSAPAGGTSTTTTVPPPTTTTSAASATACGPAGLHAAQRGFQGAAGTVEMTFSLTNTSSSTCTMHGYPNLVLLNSGGAAATTVVRGGPLAFEDVAPTQVSLAPGQTAYFNVGYSDVTTGATKCSTATRVEVTPPTATSSVVVGVSPAINACDDGTLDVSAVFAATDTAATRTTAPPP